MTISTTYSVDFINDYVLSFGSGSYYEPDSASLSDGGWVTGAIDGAGTFLLERFNSVGAKLLQYSSRHDFSAVKVAAAGTTVVAAAAHGDGSVTFKFIKINDFYYSDIALGTGTHPDIASNRDGLRVAAVWEQSYSATDSDIWVNLSDVEDTAAKQFRVDTSRALDTNASVAFLSSGNVVVAWNRTDASGNTALWYAVYADDGAGTVVTAPVQIDAVGSINHAPSVVADMAGGFVIGYEDNASGDVEARAYTHRADGFVTLASLSRIDDPDIEASSAYFGSGVIGAAFTHQFIDGDAVREEDVYLNLVDTVTGASLIDPANPLLIGVDVTGGASLTSLAGDSGKFIVSYDSQGETHQRLWQLVETITGDSAANTLQGTTSGFLHLNGGSGNDILRDGEGNDRLSGGADNDLLYNGEGDDYLDGGAGSDTVRLFFRDLTGSVVSLGSTDPQDTGHGMDVLVGIENLIGTGYDDTLIGNDGANKLDDGGNAFYRGQDTLVGGGGNDTYVVHGSSDIVVETSSSGGVDLVEAGSDFTLPALVENLTLLETDRYGRALNAKGNSLANRIEGNFGYKDLDDVLHEDVLTGLGGNDTYIVKTSGTKVVETSNGGSDTVTAAVSFTLASSNWVELLQTTLASGSAAIDLTGNNIAQGIIGNNGANKLGGLGGDDLLFGLGGNDTLTGGTGKDTFQFNTQLSSAGNVDAITDFNPVDDTIKLAKSIFAALNVGALSSDAFWKSTAGVAHDTSDRIIYDTDSGALFYDADGNMAGGVGAIKFAVVGINLALANADFTVA